MAGKGIRSVRLHVGPIAMGQSQQKRKVDGSRRLGRRELVVSHLKVLSPPLIAPIASRLMIQWRVGFNCVGPHTLDTPNVNGVFSMLWLVKVEVFNRASFHLSVDKAFELTERLPLALTSNWLADLDFAKRI